MIEIPRHTLAMASLSALALASAAFPEGARAETTYSKNVRVNSDQSEARWHGMPAIAVDPNNPRHVVVTARHQQPDGSASCEAHTSYDAMATFTHVEVPVPASCARFNTQQRIAVGIGSNSKTYVAADGPEQAFVVPSSDGGLTFEPAVAADTLSGSRIRLAVRVTPGAKDELYVARQAAEPLATTVIGNVGPTTEIAAVVVSTDGGASFAPRVRANEVAIGPEGPRIAVGPAGRVYVLYMTVAPSQIVPTASVRLARSLDRGRTWLRPDIIVDGSITKAPSSELNNYWPDLAVDQRTGAVFVSWSDERDGDADVFFRRSLDHGATFEALQRLSAEPPKSGINEYRTGLAVSPTGRVEAVYYAARNTCPGQTIACYVTNVLQRTSTDQGAAFGPPVQLNERSFDYRLRRGAWQGGDIRDVVASAAAAEQVTYAAWLDTQLGTVDNYNRDVFASRAQLAPFTRLIPPPVYRIIPTPPPVLKPPPPPVTPQAPLPPPPIPPAAPIAPPQPPPLLGAQVPIPVVGPLVAPAPGPEPQPQMSYQEATTRHHDARASAVLGIGMTAGVSIVAFCLALAAGTGRGARPAVQLIATGTRRLQRRRP